MKMHKTPRLCRLLHYHSRCYCSVLTPMPRTVSLVSKELLTEFAHREDRALEGRRLSQLLMNHLPPIWLLIRLIETKIYIIVNLNGIVNVSGVIPYVRTCLNGELLSLSGEPFSTQAIPGCEPFI